MTFSISVPNATQSPGLFPAQANTNFDRLKAIINQEHNFLDTEPIPADSQGIHRQCTFINRSTPVGLPAGNGILYSNTDSFSASQLFWYNGATNIQITPGVQTITAYNSFTAGSSYTVFADPGYAYMAYVWSGVNGDSSSTTLNQAVAIHYGNDVNLVTPNQASAIGAFIYPSMSNDLTIKNQDSISRNLIWTLMIIRMG